MTIHDARVITAATDLFRELDLTEADFSVILESWGKGKEDSILFNRLQDRLESIRAALKLTR